MSSHIWFVKPLYLCSHILWPLAHQVPPWRIRARRVICYPFGKLSWTLISPCCIFCPSAAIPHTTTSPPTPPFWWIAGRMKASSRSHHQGYGNLGPASGGYLPPISTTERGSERGRRGAEICAVWSCSGEKEQSKDSSFMGFKSAWQFLETGAGWDSDYSSSVATTLILPAPLSPTLLQQVDVSLPSFCHWSPSPYMPWLLAEEHYGLLWRTGGTYPNESFSHFRVYGWARFQAWVYEWIYLSVDWMDWRLVYRHILNNIYLHPEISEGGNGAISVNELRKCMETFIIYLLWFIIHGEKSYNTNSGPFHKNIHGLYKSKRLRAHSETLLPITKYNSHISHALLWPSSPTASEPFPCHLSSQPTVWRLSLSHSHRCPPPHNKWPTNNPYI